MDPSSIETFPDQDKLAAAAAGLFFSAGAEALAARRRFCVCLSGGNTPRRVHACIVAHPAAAAFDWGATHFFWGDERAVPPDHADSNFGMATDSLLKHLPVPSGNLHRIRGELPAVEAATLYAAELRAFFEGQVSPAFDLLFLGLGADAHVASLFPGTAPLTESREWVAGHFVPAQNSWRVTLTPPALLGARRIAVLVTGAAKAAAVRRVWSGVHEPLMVPGQLLRSVADRCSWLLDEAAAAELGQDHGGGAGS